jgi:hypothetical protein
MRCVLALALVFYFSGVPAGWAKPCAMAATRGEHACCLTQKGPAAAHLSATCGCQMTPAMPGPAPSAVAAPPDVAADHAAPVAVAAVRFVPPSPTGLRADGLAPPGPSLGGPLSRLSGSGFRC